MREDNQDWDDYAKYEQSPAAKRQAQAGAEIVGSDLQEKRHMMLKKYRCHKVVHAGEILGISLDGQLAFGVGNFITKPKEWLDKFKPEVGGYYVEYEDGYSSYSPRKAFEDGYSLVSLRPGV